MNQERVEPRWVRRTVAQTIHSEQVRQHGGSPGIRDEGLLESALERPRNRWHYDTTADLPTLTAAYGFGIARNHPFIDGNKRVAFQAMYVFLGLNGFRIVADEPEVVALMLEVAAGRRDEISLADWLRTHIESR
ncbi:type II toxin-antitoxin system death-on-curing family toxin [soil metagenome]